MHDQQKTVPVPGDAVGPDATGSQSGSQCLLLNMTFTAGSSRASNLLRGRSRIWWRWPNPIGRPELNFQKIDMRLINLHLQSQASILGTPSEGDPQGRAPGSWTPWIRWGPRLHAGASVP